MLLTDDWRSVCNLIFYFMQLDKYQASVLAFLFERLPIDDDADSLEFSLSSAFRGKYRAVHSEIEFTDQPARVVFTLPTYSNSVFLALTRASATDAALVLANLEDYERESSLQLKLGEVIITPHHALLSADTPQSVILFRTATSLDCAKVPDCQTIEGKPTLFFLVVPLTTEECEFRCQHGHDALISRFQADQKDIFF